MFTSYQLDLLMHLDPKDLPIIIIISKLEFFW